MKLFTGPNCRHFINKYAVGSKFIASYGFNFMIHLSLIISKFFVSALTENVVLCLSCFF